MDWNRENDVFGHIYPGKIDDSGRSGAGRGIAIFGSPEFPRNVESADAIGVSGVVVSLDLATHRL